MKILLDCDACPVVVRDYAVKMAKENNLEIFFISNYCHELYDDYAKIIVTDKGMDSADFVLFQKTDKDDIVVTNDYGLAATVLSKKAKVISFGGFLYTDENIDGLLETRYINKRLRKGKNKTNKMLKAYDGKFSFKKALDELILEEEKP